MTRRSTGATVAGLLALAALLGATGLAAQAPAAPARTMTLDQAVDEALQHSPQIVQGEGAVKTAAAGERAARGAFLPSLSVSTGATLSGANRGTIGIGTSTGVPQDATSLFNPTTNYTAGVAASLDVFDGGKRSAQLERSRAVAAQADAGLDSQRNSAALAARSGFFDVLRAGELATAAEAEAQRASDALSAAQKRLNAGAATRSDVLRAQLSLTQAQQALSQAKSQERTAEYALGRTVGYDGPVVPQASSAALSPKPLALSAAQLDSLVTTQAPAVVAAEAGLRASSALIGAAKADYLPKVSVSAGYDFASRSTTSLADANNSWALRAAVTLPLFDGFQREQAVTQAKVATDDAQATLEDARRGQRVELQRDLAALSDAEQQIALGQQAVASAQEDLRVQQERYRLGAATMLDVITSQSALAQAEKQLVNSRYDYQTARAALEALAGRAL